MGKRTPLYDAHVQAQGKMVDFAGWDMPLHYGSQLQEHHKVRQAAGVFDVSHMGIVDMHGKETAAFLRYLLANNIDKLTYGKALYTCLLNEQGKVLDDLIVYKINDDFFRIVVNAGTREKDLAWFQKQAQGKDVKITERTDLAMLAIQGPLVKDKLADLFSAELAARIQALKPFFALQNGEWMIARTGYTGEDGIEVMLPAKEVLAFWQKILANNIAPCGLGARDTLRLEAGMNLYGSDMDEEVTPLESGLTWTVAWEPADRNFIGRASLEKQQQTGVKQRLVGLVLEGPGVLRSHQKVIIDGLGEGTTTSGGFSPTLNKGIALARVPAKVGDQCLVEVRGKQMPALVVKPPFVRHGKKIY